jgi:hypothetical protein
VLPFGLSSSPPLWERVSRALEWLVRRYVTDHVTHYVDDFLLAEEPGKDAHRVVKRTLALFAFLGVTVSTNKLVGPATRLEYLGVTIDTIERISQVEDKKRKKLIAALRQMRSSWNVPYKRLESVIGLLQFVTNVVRPGKAFIGRLRDSLYKAESHMVQLGPVGKADIEWWLHFLPKWPGLTYIPDPVETVSNSVALVTDACKEGFGAALGQKWLHGPWPEEWLEKAWVEKDLSMPYLELGAIWVAARSWTDLFRGKKVVIHCDCMPVVQAIRSSYSAKPAMLTLIRNLVALAICTPFTFRIIHISTNANSLADKLSRDLLQEARSEFPWLEKEPTAPVTSTGKDW